MKSLFANDNSIMFNQLIKATFISIAIILITIFSSIFISISFSVFLLCIDVFILIPLIILVFFKKGLDNLNKKYQITEHKIKKRVLLFAFVLKALFFGLIVQIPFLGFFFTLFLTPIFDMLFLYKNLEHGKIGLNFNEFDNIFSTYSKYSIKYMLLIFLGDFTIFLLVIIFLITGLANSYAAASFILIFSLCIGIYITAFNATRLMKSLKKTNN